MLGMLSKTQLPQECWGTELQPFNEQFEIDPACETWDVVEQVAQRLGVAVRFKGDRVLMWKDRNNNGDFDNSSEGIKFAMRFLQQVA
jgi:hypothetical protein